MPTHLNPPRRVTPKLLMGLGVFGVSCFLVGRFSARIATSATRGSVASSAMPSTLTPAPARNVNADQRAAAPAIASTPSWDEQTWQRLHSAPGTPANYAALAQFLEMLGSSDPARAMAFAQAETNAKLREKLIHAALHGWARAAPADAARWALSQATATERENGLSVVFTAAVTTNPETAVRLGQSLIQQNPNDAPGFGNRLIDALCAAGNFQTAVAMAAEGDRETRAGWMGTAYSHWAEYQPEQAARAAAAINDPELRQQALRGVAGGWGAVDPAALVAFAAGLPSDADRSATLSQALERWVKRDPKNASTWIDQHENRPEFDQGVATVATMDGIKSDVAVSWAESISNPALRSETLALVVRNWMAADPAAARAYLKASSHLLPPDRQQLDDVFAGLDRR